MNAFLGLARGLFRVVEDCTSTGRARCAGIDADASRGQTGVKAAASDCDTRPIVVEARGANSGGRGGPPESLGLAIA